MGRRGQYRDLWFTDTTETWAGERTEFTDLWFTDTTTSKIWAQEMTIQRPVVHGYNFEYNMGQRDDNLEIFG